MTLGEKIRQARRQCGMSQEQLAEKMNVSRSAVAKWETDKGLPDVGNLKTLSRLLCVSVDHLLDEGQEAEHSLMQESYDLASFGRGCKKVKKDRAVRQRFPEARIYPLLGRPEQLPVKTITEPAGCRSAAGEGLRDFHGVIRHYDKEFYLVEKAGRQYLVTVTDTFIQVQLLDLPWREQIFTMDGWCFIRCNYEV